ncbi:glycosyl transferase group 1 [Thiorhodococcus drewsii AZ1]|uniref:Glycosyl transferase group 1 n=1 Tax=Thiorhodococcus drewsii AZ1 TaxID=765913 RepID=G2DY59_9GAMM|nr:glycosyltransferase [Thiorhodococcus drewsii]EGV32851.1 glycosyl transferase group 1 [Thiorhodococcus drewsii AZ1]
MLRSSQAECQLAAEDTAAARNLRVAIISDAAPERNGVGAYYRDLADHLRARGAHVALVAPRYRAGRWHGGLRLPLPGDPTQRILIPSWSLVEKRLKRLRPNVIVVPTPGPYGLLGMHLAGRLGVHLVVGFHTHFEALTNLFQDWGVRAHIANAYLRGCHRLLFSRSQVVLANSIEMVEVARSIGAKRVSLMATPIPKRFLDRAPSPTRPQIERILFAGRLAPEKNLDAVVEAARRLPDLEFVIAGDGPLREWLEQEAGELPNLTLVGWVKRTQILRLIDSVDALVLPSRVESFGTIALEAMARARPVLVSGACGILSWDILSGGIFTIREDEHLADALLRLRQLDAASLQNTTEMAREAAGIINQRNLQHWLALLAGDHASTVDGQQ